jgi:hypothetical protein
VRLLFGIIVTLTVAAAVGLGATWFALTHELTFGAVQIGAWVAHPKNGTIDIDPYARATIARSGELPMGSGDGVAFAARHDDLGRPFDGRCEMTISGTTPPARYWTLTLYDPQGGLVANSADRYGFTSREILRRADGSFEIAVAPRARAGNWLPTGGADHFVLVLRFYDTPVGATTRTGRESPMPSVLIGECP